MKVLRLFICCLIVFSNAENKYSQQISFSSLNGPYGGNLGDVVFSSGGEIFVSAYYSDGKGIYNSTDTGLSWELLPPVYPFNEIFALEINKKDILFAGSGYYSGLFRSTDLGASWTWLSGYTRPECWAIAFNDSDHIFAGDGDWGGLMRSTDDGDSWVQVLPNSVAVISISMDSVGAIYVGASNNFYKSTDNGVTWTSIYSGLPSLEIAATLCKQRDYIFVGTGYISQGDGVYHSTNGGENWIQRGLSGQTVYSLALDDNGTLFAGTKDSGIYKSNDNGLNWQQINNGLYSKNIFRVKTGPSNLLYACSESDGGIYRSSNLGESWDITGVTAGTINRAIILDDGNLFAATFNGVQKYDIITQKWSILGLSFVAPNPGWNWLSDIIIDNDNVMFASSWSGKVFKSTDYGGTWDTTSNIHSYQTHVTDMALYTDNSILLGIYGFVKRSTDKGITWTSIINGLPNSLIQNIEVTEEGVIYAVSGNKLCKANHIDSSFVVIRDGIYASSPPIFNRIDSGNNGLIFFADQGVNQGIYRSTDYGETWSKIYNNSVYSLSLFNNKYVVAGLPAGEGILFSSNLGNTWEYLNEGIHSNAIIIWNIIDSDGYLYASASGLGLYKSNQILTSVNVQVPNEKISFSLEQNYPNPFNSTTNIKYSIPQAGRVILKVYDIAGRVVAVLLDRYQETGSYDVIFQSKDLASGIYFYTLTSGKFTSTKKLILLK
jgi:photosystem II stability/assembly factor-like uncharacterized protein